MKSEAIKTKILNIESKINKLRTLLEKQKLSHDKSINKLIEKGVGFDSCDNKEFQWELTELEEKKVIIKNNLKKLALAEIDLVKLNELLEQTIEKETTIEYFLPKCLKDHLEDWKNKCRAYYVELCEQYIYIKNKDYEVTRVELEQLMEYKFKTKTINGKSFNCKALERKYNDEEIGVILKNGADNVIKTRIRNKYLQDFNEKIGTNSSELVLKMVKNNEIQTNIIEKILEDEVSSKKIKFYNRISDVVGDIKSMTCFEIGANGEINGIATGSKSKASVKTILAGGHSIQCLHFRVTTKELKGDK